MGVQIRLVQWLKKLWCLNWQPTCKVVDSVQNHVQMMDKRHRHETHQVLGRTSNRMVRRQKRKKNAVQNKQQWMVVAMRNRQTFKIWSRNKLEIAIGATLWIPNHKHTQMTNNIYPKNGINLKTKTSFNSACDFIKTHSHTRHILKHTRGHQRTIFSKFSQLECILMRSRIVRDFRFVRIFFSLWY